MKELLALLVYALAVFLAVSGENKTESATQSEPTTETEPTKEPEVKMVSLKIVQAPALSRFTPLQKKVLVPRMQPCGLAAPKHLLLLNNTCYKFKHKNYIYNLCPFQNITQKEDTTRVSGYHGVLGIWSDWIIENDTFAGMVYSKGEKCGLIDRQAKVFFNCSTVVQLTNITEPKTCHYEMFFHTPLACFKGAMQIFHLLPSEVMKKWETLEHEYYSEEWTLQGFNKKKQELLREANFLAPLPGKEKPTDPPTRAPLPVMTTSCEKEKEELLEEVANLRSEVMRLTNLLGLNTTNITTDTANSTLPTATTTATAMTSTTILNSTSEVVNVTKNDPE